MRGISTVTGKADGLAIMTNQERVVSHLEEVLAADRKLLDRFDRVTRENIHEIRGINSGLYHAAVELADSIPPEPRLKRCNDLANNIVALSQILSARIDFINYLADESLLEIDFGTVQIYKKFDKMTRCFMAMAGRRNVNLVMRGSSYLSSFGPRSLVELVAYLLLDNALKYSPPYKDVQIEVNDRKNSVEACLTSIGPRILDEEVNRIFEIDYRGKLAQESGKSGSGIGLHVLKSLVDRAFLGTIELVRGDEQLTINNVPYDLVSFRVMFPVLTAPD